MSQVKRKDWEDKQRAVTVYPSMAGGFPPASFWQDSYAFAYAREVQDAGAACGICICPARSYAVHYPETVRRSYAA